MKKILVLLIGEVLEDPRVYRTCVSLSEGGADVTVACTNPSQRTERETYKNLSIIRFPHRKEFIIKEICTDLGVNIQSISEDEPLIESGIVDSLGILQILSFLDEELGIDLSSDGIDPEKFVDIKTICQMAEKHIQ